MMIIFMVLFAFLAYQTKNPNNSENTQIMYLMAAAFSMGFLVGPGINMYAAVKPEVLT